MVSSSSPPNYYAILEVLETATAQQIRDAYKKAALKTHPDRVPADSPDRASRTRRFQLVNDAYYTLSDAARRREYDAQRKLFGGTARPSAYADPFAEAEAAAASSDEDEDADDTTTPGPGTGAGATGGAQNAYSWAWSHFTGQRGANASRARERAGNAQFEDVFEEMMRDEGLAEDGTNRPTSKFWSLVGGASGAALGFIVANVPGLLAGAVAGNRLGAIRDARGKSVYAVFQELPADDRARLLTQLAARVFSQTVGM